MEMGISERDSRRGGRRSGAEKKSNENNGPPPVVHKRDACHRRIPLSRPTPSSLRIPAEDVLGYVLTLPESSVQDIRKACSYSKVTMWNILHTYGSYPYRSVLAQELMPGD
ncbi:DUF4817 domain-containing protein [Trichonephila clavipes]|nr:DUF4817 domain-containing protein [Trichonephila clavipes]